MKFLLAISKPFIQLYVWYVVIFNRRCYYVTGTGLHKTTGERMWWKCCFHTYGNRIPIKSIEEKTSQELGLKTCVVLNFNRIPLGMAKSIEGNNYNVEVDKRYE